MGHTALDCYFRDASLPKGSRLEAHILKGSSKLDEVIAQAQPIVDMVKPDYFVIRLRLSKGDRILYDSRNTEPRSTEPRKGVVDADWT
jgi:hypothetical protein